jgi:alpha-aminoadipic semialdehyde synthase
VKGLALECLPNRDSLSYASTYGLGPAESLESVFRGTLRCDDALMVGNYTNCACRYKGFSSLMRGFQVAGMLDPESLIDLNLRGGWQSFLAQCLSGVHKTIVKNDRRSLSAALRSLLPESAVADLLEAAEWCVRSDSPH